MTDEQLDIARQLLESVRSASRFWNGEPGCSWNDWSAMDRADWADKLSDLVDKGDKLLNNC